MAVADIRRALQQRVLVVRVAVRQAQLPLIRLEHLVRLILVVAAVALPVDRPAPIRYLLVVLGAFCFLFRRVTTAVRRPEAPLL